MTSWVIVTQVTEHDNGHRIVIYVTITGHMIM